MTPKKKAQELYRKTYKKAMQIRGSDLMTKVAKEFTLSMIEEIIEEVRDTADEESLTPKIIYWMKVKDEIESYND